MALSELSPAERHRVIAHDFADLAGRVADWDAPAPVDGWTARDVVRHLVTWLPGFLAGGGVALRQVPAAAGHAAEAGQPVPVDRSAPSGGATVSGDPLTAWTLHSVSVQEVLDDSVLANSPFAHQQVGEMLLETAIDRFYTADVFMHTWDLARASGQHANLEPAFCAELLAGMGPMERVIRSSGQFGPRVAVASDADAQTRLIGFIGRDPFWQPPETTT